MTITITEIWTLDTAALLDNMTVRRVMTRVSGRRRSLGTASRSPWGISTANRARISRSAKGLRPSIWQGRTQQAVAIVTALTAVGALLYTAKSVTDASRAAS